MSVSMYAECSASTRVRCSRSSLRIAFVAAHAAAFEMPYAPVFGKPSHDSTDSTLTIAPPPFSRSTGANARAIASGPKKFVSSCACRPPPSASASSEPIRKMPALLTSRLTSRNSRAAAAISCARVTSSRTGCTPGVVTRAGSRAAA